MSKIRKAVLTVVVAVTCLATLRLEASNAVLTLSLDPPQTLPGIPVTFRVTATNTTSKAITLPNRVVLQVTPEKGASFLTAVGMPRSQTVVTTFPVDDLPVRLAAGESRRLDYWAMPDSPPWYAGPFWLEPGNYKLRLIADDGLIEDKLTGDGLTLSEPFLKDPILSNEALLTILVPTGVDAEVWRLAKTADSWNWQDRIAEKVWEVYPSSEYAGYLVPPNGGYDMDLRIKLLARCIERNPRGAYSDLFRLDLARTYLQRINRILKTGDVTSAFRSSENARVLLDRVLQSDTEPTIKREAKELRTTRIATLESLTRRRDEFLRDHSGQVPQKTDH
jgi:hypothetical protein